MTDTYSLQNMMGVPAINTGLAYPGVNIPELQSNEKIAEMKTVNTGRQVYNKQQQSDFKSLRKRVHNLEASYAELEITEIAFSLYSTDEKRKLAVILCNNPDPFGANTVRDDKFGPRNQSQRCGSCHMDMVKCPGHYGLIEHPPFFHKLALGIIKDTLECVCPACSKLLLSKDEIEYNGYHRLSITKRVAAIAEHIRKAKLSCRHNSDIPGVVSCGEKQYGTPIPIYNSINSNEKDYCLSYTYPGAKSTKYYRTPDEALEILENISPEDASALGFSAASPPKNMIQENTLVIPYNTRPDLNQGDLFKADDLTLSYQEMIRCVNKLQENQDQKRDSTTMNTLYAKISSIMKSELSKNHGNKEYMDIKKRIQGKGGIIRQNLMGKRTDHAGRSVVGPGIDLRVDQIGIPQEMAVKWTYPEICTAYNRAECQSEYDNNRVVFIERVNDPNFVGAKQIVCEKFRRMNINYQIQQGDIIHRLMRDGDIVLVNRQPSLHKESVLALYVKIISSRTIKINLSITTPLNADFDGDEVNVHVPQTYEARIEAEQLASVAANLMSGENNKSMMHIVYDSLLSAYLLTRDEELGRLKHAEDLKDIQHDRLYYDKRAAIEGEQIPEIERNRKLEKIAKDNSIYVGQRVIDRKKLLSQHREKSKNYDRDYSILLNQVNNYDLGTEYNALQAELGNYKAIIETYDQLILGYQTLGINGDPLKYAEISKLKPTIKRVNTIKERMEEIKDNDQKYQELINSFHNYQKKVGILPIEVFESALEKAKDNIALDSLKERAAYYGVPWQSRRILFSAALPEGFYYNNYDVVIKDGILISGTIDKKTIGSSDNSIISEMYKTMGGYTTVDFMSYVQFILYEYLDSIGFSVGISDCLPTTDDISIKEFKKKLDEYIKNAEVKVLALADTPKNKFEARKKELKIMAALDIAKSIGDDLVIRMADPNNAFMIMAVSGAKGSSINFANISSLVGQQNVNGNRIIDNLPGNRSLPVVEPNSQAPESRGFCSQSFYNGLNVISWFFHSASVRENLTDTAVNTRRTGDLQHNLIKSGEDAHVAPDGGVKGADGTIIQFLYGEDGLNPSQLTRFKIMGQNQLLFRNVEHAAFQINAKYEKLLRTGRLVPTNNPKASLVPKINS